MLIFFEKFLLPIAAGIVVLLAVTNPMGFDWRQRASLGLAIVFFAYFVSYTIERVGVVELEAATASATELERSSGLTETNVLARQEEPEDQPTELEPEDRGEQVQNSQSTTGDNSPAIIGNNNSVTINSTPQMRPSIEGVTATVRQVPSRRDDAPFALEVTVQVQANVAPFGLGFIADRPIVGGSVSGARFNYMAGTLDTAPDRSYWFHFESPAVTPQSPLLVTIFGIEPFSIVSAQRMALRVR